jgi:hypothetical protein
MRMAGTKLHRAVRLRWPGSIVSPRDTTGPDQQFSRMTRNNGFPEEQSVHDRRDASQVGHLNMAFSMDAYNVVAQFTFSGRSSKEK